MVCLYDIKAIFPIIITTFNHSLNYIFIVKILLNSLISQIRYFNDVTTAQLTLVRTTYSVVVAVVTKCHCTSVTIGDILMSARITMI